MIEVIDVVKRYGGVKVVDEVSLTIPKGKITSLIGPNGAGKSTLLSMISRLVPRDSGQIHIDGTELGEWDKRDLARRISILRQSNHIDLKLTIRELVSFGRFPHTQGNLRDEDWVIVDRALEYLHLTDIQDKYLHQLSGGQRQRAYLAMVIAQDTDYVFLDEPLNNLDMQHAVEIMQILRSLVRDLSKTVVLVIHDINIAACYSDYIVAMQDGQVVKAGDSEVIMDRSVLRDIYKLDFHIGHVNNQRICVYYN
ncbi:MAG TPA: ATP-binding cassette domain-containing protein [Firmicutes bacterium]|jgi:iron complex transport system ATP-binding protein|nr:ATP-binding cassette domain-containing protein [Bacillota bacterium]